MNVLLRIIIMSVIMSSAATQAVASTNKFEIVNSGPDFEKYWKMQEGLSLDEKTVLFERLIINKHEEIYKKAVFHDKKQSRKKVIRSYIKNLDETNANAIIKFSKKFGHLTKKQVERFKKHFKGVDFKIEIYGIFSFETFWGKMFDLTNKPGAVAFDISRIHTYDEHKIEIIFAHELLHALHMQLTDVMPVENLMQGMWTEGLAVYGSGAVNGKYDGESTIGPKNYEKCGDLSNIIGEFRRVMYKKNEGEIEKKWMIANGPAYCLGFEVVKHLSARYKLSEMIYWKREHLPPIIENAFNELQN